MQFSKEDIWKMATRIDKIVEGSGMSRGEFADMLGVKSCTLSTWTGAHQIPSLPNLLAIARFAGLTLDEMFEGILEVPKK